MKTFIFAIGILFSQISILSAQSSGEYYRRFSVYLNHLDCGNIAYKQDNYTQAIKEFECAIRIYPTQYLDGKYSKLAYCFLELKQVDSSIFYLEKAIEQSHSMCETIFNDSTFKPFIENEKIREVLSKYCKDVKTKDTKAVANKKLRNELLFMAECERKYRSKTMGEHYNHLQDSLDNLNFKFLQTITDKYGWPSDSMVGKDAQEAAWVVLQHCDYDFKKKCLPLMQKSVNEKKTSPLYLAYLKDMIQMSVGKKQIYGTQILTTSIWDAIGQPKVSGYDIKLHYGKNVILIPVSDEENLDKRREAVGLVPIAVQLKEVGISYQYKD